MKLLESLLFVVAVGIFAYIYFKKFISGSTATKEEIQTGKEVENITPANLIGKRKFKLVSYNEALEASREFIYKIAKTVMERFSPEAKETLLDLGTKLFRAGAQYIHVVDIFKISLDKQRTISAIKPKEQIKGQQK